MNRLLVRFSNALGYEMEVEIKQCYMIFFNYIYIYIYIYILKVKQSFLLVPLNEVDIQ